MGMTDGKEPLIIYTIVCWGNDSTVIVLVKLKWMDFSLYSCGHIVGCVNNTDWKIWS